MILRVGTSGFSYKEWKGVFYPEDLPASAMLHYYAERFSTVEINNTFYRMPVEKTLSQWAGQVPPGFRFVLKAPQRITHQKKLEGAGEDARHLLEVGAALGERLGPILFQLPPYLRKDLPRLRAFLDELPGGARAAFEFRHASWFDGEALDLLRERGAALCVADTDEQPAEDAPGLKGGDWGYARLRRLEYTPEDLRRWAERVAASGWTEAWVFFKHEDEARGPAFAREFLGAIGGLPLTPA